MDVNLVSDKSGRLNHLSTGPLGQVRFELRNSGGLAELLIGVDESGGQDTNRLHRVLVYLFEQFE
jgi:hypothetical protein